MSRIYNNSSLTNLPVETVNVKHWSTKDCESKGDGVLLEGIVRRKSRFLVIENTDKKLRYFVFHVDVKRAHSRKFDSSGLEITPNFSETKKVSTGYLMSSYKSVAKGSTDLLDNTTLRKLVHVDFLSDITKKRDSSDSILFWIDESRVDKLDIDIGDEVRIKSKGNSQMIEQICRVEVTSKTVSNFAGDEAVGSSWTDKVFANKSEKTVVQAEGVDDDEWDD